MDDVVDHEPRRYIYLLEQRIERLTEALEDIINASRDEGLSHMVLAMRNRAYRGIEESRRHA